MFDVTGKVAVITGGMSEAGCECAKVLLWNGLKVRNTMYNIFSFFQF